MGRVTWTLVVLCLVELGRVAVWGFVPNDDVLRETSRLLYEKIRREQVKHTTKAELPPLLWGKLKGTWESDIKFNFHGRPEMTLFRELFYVLDDNMFATGWITNCLLEVFKYGGDIKPDQQMITDAINSFKDYRNKNVGHKNSLMTFWPQHYNETTQSWLSWPDNLHAFFVETDYMPLNATFKILEALGLKDIEHIMQSLMRSKNGYLKAFEIPPDFDDTYLNVGVGSMLTELSEDFQEALDLWKSHNPNLTSVFDATKHYAYRPLSNDSRINVIDPRTYMYMHTFLEQAKARGDNPAFVPTWIQDLVEIRTWYDKGVIMPFNVNNVDVTVAANSVFGITNAVLTGLAPPSTLDDPDLQNIYMDTAELIAYEVANNVSSRPDLALTYYPSVLEFYWFVARTYSHLLEYKTKTGSLPHPALTQVLQMLEPAVQGKMTQHVLQEANEDGPDMVYYDDFLGNNDLDKNNVTVNHAEDRLYTTTMAAQALQTTWTQLNSDGKLQWLPNTPDTVKSTVARAVTWLFEHVLGGEYKPYNAFFSGSMKGFTTYPTEYPHNFRSSFKTATGTHGINGMQGIPSPADFNKMITKRTPTVFHGYNSRSGDYFPFWSCESYTDVTTMLVLSKYANTVKE